MFLSRANLVLYSRPYLLSSAALFNTAGNLLATGVVRGTLNIPNDYAWRIPYAIQWFWPIPLLVAAAFAPESPYWLVRKDRISDAQRAVARLAFRPKEGRRPHRAYQRAREEYGGWN